MTDEQELEEVLDKAAPEMADIARTFWRIGVEAAEKRIRRELEAEMDGPGIDWSDVDQVQAMIDRICPERKG